jgi:SAM-dependent methyltransferase
MEAEHVRSLEAEKAFWSDPDNSRHFSRPYWEAELARDELDFSLFEGKIVCEIGAGPLGMIYFADAKARIAVDPLIRFYEELGLLSVEDDQDVRLIEAGGEAIPEVEDDCVDVVICYNVLDHVHAPERVLREARRILRADGLLYLNCHIVRSVFSPVRKPLRLIDPPHPHHFSKSDLVRLLERSGFECQREMLYPMKTSGESWRLAAAGLGMKHYAVLATPNE